MELIYSPSFENHFFPRGAVCQGKSIRLFVKTSAAEACTMMLRRDGQSEAEAFPMQATEGGFALTLTLSEPGLYFYHFLAESENEVCAFGADAAENACKGTGEWPLLVYDAAFELPDWLCGVVMYQIFPDRFAREGEIPTDYRNQRFLHMDVTERPRFTMDESDYQATDFYGGNLAGVMSRLPYLKRLGVDVIYFNPLFEAASNHRYNTADYLQIDPMLGTNEDFSLLCQKAHALGIRVILDGVFSHTGSDSRYFNREGHYDDLGAYQSPDSPYAAWYSFGDSREDYACWWNFKTLPNVNETNPDYLQFICGENGVLRHWLRLGADGWRLDVADELPDAFLEAVRAAVKAENPNALLIGEVWEDAALKFSYGARRCFLQGRQLDSPMNYPFRSGILDCLLQSDARILADSVNNLLNHYPAPCLPGLMNLLSTHDTWRVIQILGCNHKISQDEEPFDRLSPLEYETGVQRFCRGAVLQYFLPGMPSIYYGDEVGMTGCGDPWNRRFFEWDRAEGFLPDFFRRLGKLRHDKADFFKGKFEISADGKEKLSLIWTKDGRQLGVALNFGEAEWHLETGGKALLSLGQTADKTDVLAPFGLLVWEN